MMTKNKTAAKKTEDQSVVYKVPAAFVLMIVVIYAFWKLGGYYSTVEGFTALYPMFCVQRYVFLALTAAELVLCVLLKNGLARTICRYWLAAFALLFVSSLILSIFWTGNMIVIYLLHALVYCLYMVWQLYHSEFFTFSLVTASAGVVFFLIARTSYMANRIAGSALLALILIGTALTAFLCAKNHGKLNLGSRMLRLFGRVQSAAVLFHLRALGCRAGRLPALRLRLRVLCHVRSNCRRADRRGVLYLPVEIKSVIDTPSAP
jgi:hypothetical protein